MRSIKLSWLLMVLLAVATRTLSAADGELNSLTDAEKKAGWQLLFNGSDHTGWRCNNGKKIAAPIEDNALVPYKSGGYLIIHEKQFADFVLKCDVRMPKGRCNSGIFFRVGDPKRPVYTGLEMQVLNGRGTGYHDFGAIYDLVKPSKNNLKSPGQWNAVEIRCQGPKISVKVNGELVTKMNCDEFDKKGLRPDGSRHKFGVAIKQMPRRGYVGFQDHGAKVWYRNVKLLELGAKDSDAAKATSKAEARAAARKYLRVVREPGGRGKPISLETSIVGFTASKGKYKGVVVDLIGAVHIADKAYYEKLNKRFEGYESLLYELVAAGGFPKDGKKDKRGGAVGVIGTMQRGLKNTLDLSFQLDEIDYAKKNFVHADMSPEQFAKSMADRDESWLKMYFRMMGYAIAQQSRGKGPSDFDLLAALLAGNQATALKRIMSEQFADMGGVLRALDGKRGSTIIGERNRVALEVLKKQLDGGKRKVAIFYGAGHMADMERRLKKDFGLTPGKIEWIEAWDMRDPKRSPKKRPDSGRTPKKK